MKIVYTRAITEDVRTIKDQKLIAYENEVVILARLLKRNDIYKVFPT